jgi:hypothetical protein
VEATCCNEKKGGEDGIWNIRSDVKMQI